jgi:hypothetical protein
MALVPEKPEVPAVPDVPDVPLEPDVPDVILATASTIPSVAIRIPFNSLILTSPVKRPCIAIFIFLY